MIIGKSERARLKLISGQINQSGRYLWLTVQETFHVIRQWFTKMCLFDDAKNNITLGSSYSSEQIGEVIKKSGLSEVGWLFQSTTLQWKRTKALSPEVKDRGLLLREPYCMERSYCLLMKLLPVLTHAWLLEVENNLLCLSGVTIIEVTHHLNVAQQSKYDAVFEMTPRACRDKQ